MKVNAWAYQIQEHTKGYKERFSITQNKTGGEFSRKSSLTELCKIQKTMKQFTYLLPVGFLWREEGTRLYAWAYARARKEEGTRLYAWAYAKARHETLCVGICEGTARDFMRGRMREHGRKRARDCRLYAWA